GRKPDAQSDNYAANSTISTSPEQCPQRPPLTNAASNRFLELDFIRGICAVSVIFFHWRGNYANWIWDNTYFFGNAFFAVDIFFILSGFVMSHAYGAKIQENKINLGSFALLRFGRLYSLVVVGSICAVLTMRLLYNSGGVKTNDLFMNLFLFQGISGKPDGFIGVFWSIGIEFWVGLTLSYGAIRYKAYFINFLIVLALLFHFYGGKDSLFFGIDVGLINWFVRRGLLGIGLGIIAYQIYLAYKDITFSDYAKRIMKVVFYALFIFIMFYMIAPRKSPPNINYAFLFILASIMILLGALLKNQYKLLCAKWQSWLGDVSYSVYVYHQVVIWFTIPWIRSFNLDNVRSLIIGGIFVLTVTLIVSHYSHKYIEKPAYKWFKGKIARAQKQDRVNCVMKILP
ncbi:MAG: acyltransferase, partial [Helicobacteraceae bacterium]|nr:acyltransferase [Helicobacteraceae bacterium]